jgi:hypothetical protein
MKELSEFSSKIQKAFEKALKRYGDRSYVTAVDVGVKYSCGEPTNVEAIRIHVRKKKPETALEAVEIFPKSIDDVPVDVIEAHYVPKIYSNEAEMSLDRRFRFDIVQPGISVGHYRVSAGTIGLIVHDSNSGEPTILSNWHVLCGDEFAKRGDPILQPGPHDGGFGKNDTIALLERSILNENGDAAIALLNNSRQWQYNQFGTNVTIVGTRNPRKDDVLTKSGRSTGITYGRVDGMGCYFLDYSVGRRGIHGFKIVSRKPGNPDNEEISSGGDSGSLWYDPDTNEGIGLHFAGETNPSPRAEHAIACFLPRVLSALKVTIK